ncbi:MAG TPA: aminotransferase class I/II-fold pyridoxal phosphate-dependent enzyme [Xanthomonadaceae bacterium]|nr:aminotransferase class I/II-fold pyridoxal phosphate-dependent enzyme [Xanthomonadaceae bacterium]
MRFETLAVHTGGEPDAETGAIAPPIHLSSTFRHSPDGVHPGELLYQREDNPTQRRLEAALAALEGGARALFYGSGLAACSAALHAYWREDARLVMQNDCYAGFQAQVRHYAQRWGWRVDAVDLADPEAARTALARPATLVWAETPSNPLLRIVDLAALSELAHAAGARLLVDGTFATPALQQPLALGADSVLHSATKYMGGHSDVLGGVLVFAEDGAAARNAFYARELVGLAASPFAAWLVLRGLRSLAPRMRAHCQGARAVARFLAQRPEVEAVHYPGLPEAAGHALAGRQMSDFGGMLSFTLRGGREAALAVAGALVLFVNATSLGGCESLVEHRRSVEGAHPRSPENLLRLSIGLEHPDDLVADLAQALERAR